MGFIFEKPKKLAADRSLADGTGIAPRTSYALRDSPSSLMRSDRCTPGSKKFIDNRKTAVLLIVTHHAHVCIAADRGAFRSRQRRSGNLPIGVAGRPKGMSPSAHLCMKLNRFVKHGGRFPRISRCLMLLGKVAFMPDS